MAVLDEGDHGVTVRGVSPRWFAALAEFYVLHELAPLGLGSAVWLDPNADTPQTQTLRFPAGTYRQVKELLQCWQVPHWL
jgi:hypothetical protein